MKKLILVASFLSMTIAGTAQTDDVAGYVADSVFTVHVDSGTQFTYCNIEPVMMLGDDSACTRIVYNVINDYGRQPCKDTSVHGYTYSAAVFVTIYGNGVSHDVSFSINNINANSYTAWKLYGEKWIYWKISEKYNLTLNP